MTDSAGLASWIPQYNAWKEETSSLFAQGKAKEAFMKYPWFQTQEDPFAKLERPAAQSRFGLVTTGGYSVEGEHEPFSGLPDFGDTPPQIHEIGLDTDPSKFRIDHVGYDHRFAKEDFNVNLPFDRLEEMVAEGELGSIADDSLVLMGLAPNVAPLVEVTIPRIVEKLQSDSVEGALLVPS